MKGARQMKKWKKRLGAWVLIVVMVLSMVYLDDFGLPSVQASENEAVLQEETPEETSEEISEEKTEEMPEEPQEETPEETPEGTQGETPQNPLESDPEGGADPVDVEADLENTEDPSVDTEKVPVNATEAEETLNNAESVPGKTAEESPEEDILGDELDQIQTLAEEAAQTYRITLDLDGGQINGLLGAGWTQGTGSYVWSRSVTEASAGAEYDLTLSDPYRAGYEFTGWKVNEEPAEPDGNGTIHIERDSVIVAQWEEEIYTVYFTSTDGTDTSPLWTVSVPYGATLWTEESAPWTGLKESAWTEVKDENDAPTEPRSWTATVTGLEVGGQTYEDVVVTRYLAQESTGTEAARYYYTFRAGGENNTGSFYFTYGGKTPIRTNYNFTAWKMTSSGDGFTVLKDETVFTAQYAAGVSYTFNAYYYYDNGKRVESQAAFNTTLPESEINEDGKLVFDLNVPQLSNYEVKMPEINGVVFAKKDDGGYTVTVDVDTVFGSDSSSATNFCSFTVKYEPETISYTVEYYQQNVGAGTDKETNYTKVGTLQGSAKYGSLVPIADRPAAELNMSFDGFEISDDSLAAIRGGVVLEGTTIKIYYDRAYYYVYALPNTPEAQPVAGKVQYGAPIPANDIQNITRSGYTLADPDPWKWQMLNSDGELVDYIVPEGWEKQNMPAHDLYAVAQWVPATAEIHVLYWVEGKDSSAFQNAYTYTPEIKIPTESLLTVNLAATGYPTISGVDSVGKPITLDLANIVDTGFDEFMRAHYEGDETYAQYFSYSAANTKTSPGNINNAQITSTGDVNSDGTAITANSYQIKVNGDGTSTINVYYTRNLYTLEFVIARLNGNNDVYVCTSTNGALNNNNWYTLSGNTTIDFKDFAGNEVSKVANETTGTQIGTVQKTYRISSEQDDTRGVVGRYGTRSIGGFTYYVYTITARFDADISALWPTAANIDATGTVTIGNVPKTDTRYLSMGTNSGSAYYHAPAHSQEKNITGIYDTMNREIIDLNSNSATPDGGSGIVAHQLYAYWHYDDGSAKIRDYAYYNLYESLDTSMTDEEINDLPVFYYADADDRKYQPGDLIRYNVGTTADPDWRAFVYTNTMADRLYTTNLPYLQNQPARQGYTTAGKAYNPSYDSLVFTQNSPVTPMNVYFFYTRNTYELTLFNTNEQYSVPEALLDQKFSLTYTDETGTAKKEEITLRELGWERIEADGTITVLYNAPLNVIGQDAVIDWLTSQSGGKLEYPVETMGEEYYVFHYWYMNSNLTVLADWEDSSMQRMTGNTSLYVGWFAPRYSTAYVLNGGVWGNLTNSGEDKITYSIMQTTVGGETIIAYYPHQTTYANAPLYWYIVSDEWALYVDTLYETTAGKFLTGFDEPDKHLEWKADAALTIETMKAVSPNEYHMGSRLVGNYMCYIGADGDISNDHRKYVTINMSVGDTLSEPTAPKRSGYTFEGWYYFDEDDQNDPQFITKVYLEEVLPASQSLSSYADGYVYLDNVGSAHLLSEDDQGLYYYEEQQGYRFNYESNASVVHRNLYLYAAWKSTNNTAATVYHLVKADGLNVNAEFTPKDGTSSIKINENNTITIGNTRYYILEREERTGLYTGTTQTETAREYYKDGSSKVWLPTVSELQLVIDDTTQTVENSEAVEEAEGQTYRIANTDTVTDEGEHHYYAYFVYESTNDIAYNVYAVDLAEAVLNGTFASYTDRFDRSGTLGSVTFLESAPYVLRSDEKQVSAEDISTAIVTENAPVIPGYVVYDVWTEELQLQADNRTNNIFFYYVRDDSKVTYDVNFFLMHDGKYTDDYKITFSGIPGFSGEVLTLTDMKAAFENLVERIFTVQGYRDSQNQGEQALYERYAGAGITLEFGSGNTKDFVVGDSTGQNELTQEELTALLKDYAVDSWSPTGDTLVLSGGANIDVYLNMAELIINKVNSDNVPLQGAEFRLERLYMVPADQSVADGTETVAIDNTVYAVDETFSALFGISGSDGRILFQNLSADVEAGYIYRLTETKAPSGYNGLSEPVYVTVPYKVTGDEGEETISYSVTYTVTNTGISYLPAAGKLGGVYTTILMGGFMMMLAILAFVRGTLRPVKIRRDRRKRH